jgi:ABC-type transport system involved in multi-copper enzyme maturation permease subunit
LGKLGSRLAPILGVLACALPVTALVALLGGIDLQALFSLFAISVAMAVLGSSLALALSVRAVNAHEVMIAVVGTWCLWLLSLPLWWGASMNSGLVPPPEWFMKANPVLLVYAPYTQPGFVTPIDVATFIAAVLLLSAGFIAFTTATLRSSLREPPRPLRKRAIHHRPRRIRWPDLLPGPLLDGNPVLWREWYRYRPSRFARVVFAIYTLIALLFAGVGFVQASVYSADPKSVMPLIFGVTIQFLFGLLILSTLAANSLADERSRGSLDVLLATPLSTRSIVWGKWMGTYRIVLWLALFPGAVSLVLTCLSLSARTRSSAPASATSSLTPLILLAHIVAPCLVVGEFLAFGAAITSLGLALATWVPRLGRAVTINILIFVLITVGWPIFIAALIHPQLVALRINGWITSDRSIEDGLMVVSPFTSPMLTLDWLSAPDGSPPWKILLFAMAWCAAAGAFALVMLWATLKTFDRCLGRSTLKMPESTKLQAPARKVEPRRS